MTRTKEQRAQAPAAGQQTTKYYTRHAEDKGETTIDCSTDGYTLYRATARQVIGSPSRFPDIRNAVLQFYLRVCANEHHPLHDECSRQELTMQESGCKHRLFALLDSPDLDPNEHVLWVVAYALKVKINVYQSISKEGEPEELINAVGSDDRPVCTVVRRNNLRGAFDKTGPIGTPFRFESLLPDESGKALIEYLQAQRAETAEDPSKMQVKQMSWAWIQSAGKESWNCFNEYRPESKEADLEYNKIDDRMDAFVVTVNDAKDVAPALELFWEALKRAPNQRRWVRHSQNRDAGFLLPHCSVDAEFVKMERDLAKEQGVSAREAVHAGVLEELCSVLTFAIGRHFFLLFNIVHMLETSDKSTVPALTRLFRETIFNKNLLKLYWNFQADVSVMDGTIAHMFQQTKRESYLFCTYGGEREYAIEPRWRITSNHFQNVRPDDLKFPTEDVDCDLHRWGSNEKGIQCCCRLGNIDIASLFTYFCLMHGMAGSVKKLPWTEARYRFRYGDLLESMLSSDRLYPLLSHMKDRAGRTGKSRDAFYQDMGKPGMELEDDVMAYNIGDVAGQNMIFEQLLASDDKDFVAGCLSSYGGSRFSGRESRKVPQRPSAFGSVRGIQLWEDNPKSFEDKLFKVDEYGAVPPKPELDATSTLTAWEHDRRVQAMRDSPAMVLDADESHHSGAYVLPWRCSWKAGRHQKDISIKMHDPTRLVVSGDCVQKVDSIYEDPVVRAGTTHSEALIEILRNGKACVNGPPPGFGAAPGEIDGLPGWLERVPGKDLDQARNIFDAFQSRDHVQSSQHLGRPQPLPGMTGWTMKSVPTPESLIDEALQANAEEAWRDRGEADRWHMAHLAKFKAREALEAEDSKNEESGRPYLLDLHDFFDLEGREYQKRAEEAQSWNRPPLQPRPKPSEDGVLRSLASLQLAALHDKERIPDDDGFEVVTKKWKRRYW